MAVPVTAVLPVDRLKVELADHVENEPGEVAVGQPVAQVRGSRKDWSRYAAMQGDPLRVG